MLPSLFATLLTGLVCLPDPPASQQGPGTASVAPPARTVGDHATPVFRLGFSAKGSNVFTATSEGEVKLWDVASGELIGEYRSDLEIPLFDLKVSRDEKRVAVLYLGPTIRFLDAKTAAYDKSKMYLKSTGVVVAGAVEWDVKGDYVYTTSPQGAVQRVPRAAKGGFEELDIDVKAVGAFALDKSGKRLAAGCDDGTIRIIKTYTHSLERTLEGHERAVACLAFHPKGTEIASGSRDKNVMIWKPTSSKGSRTLSGHKGRVRCVAYHPKGRFLASGDSGGVVKLWDLKEDQCVLTIDPTEKGDIHALEFSPDGDTLASGGLGMAVTLWDVSDLF